MKSILIILFLTLNCIANSQVVLNITSDQSTNFMKLFVLDDYSQITKFILKTYNDKKILVETKEFDSDKSLEGITLLEKNNKKVIEIRSKDFNPYTGGFFDMYYLRNFITNKRKTVTLQISKENDKWEVLFDNVIINKVHFITSRFGVKEIQFYQSY